MSQAIEIIKNRRSVGNCIPGGITLYTSSGRKLRPLLCLQFST